MATHPSILAWKIPWTEEPGGLQSTGSQRVEHDRATSTSLVVQWLGLGALTAKGLGSTPGGRIKVPPASLCVQRNNNKNTNCPLSQDSLSSPYSLELKWSSFYKRALTLEFFFLEVRPPGKSLELFSYFWMLKLITYILEVLLICEISNFYFIPSLARFSYIGVLNFVEYFALGLLLWTRFFTPYYIF